MVRYAHWSVAIILSLALTACAHVYEKPYQLSHGTGTWEGAKPCSPNTESDVCCHKRTTERCGGSFWTNIADDGCSNDALAQERAHYPSIAKQNAEGSGANALPLLGVALSGGGARSASTSIGFLHGLDHAGVLAQVDIISSVSGGSYASYWFFSHLHHNADRVRAGSELKLLRDDQVQKDQYKLLFEPTGRFQRQVEFNSRLATKSQGPIKLEFELALEGLTWLPTIPLHWLTAGLFDLKKNLNPLTHYYHAGLERAYGLYPLDESCPSSKTFANDAPLHILNAPVCAFPRFEADDPPMKAIKAFHTTQATPSKVIPPFWVINATAAYGGRTKMFREASFGGFSHDLRDTVFEFTPIHYGSPRYGYWPYPAADEQGDGTPGRVSRSADDVDIRQLKYGRVVGASGAAVDGINPILNAVLDVLNAAIGRYIDNPRVDNSVRQVHRWLPFPFYGLHRPHHNATSPMIYLTDGGHSENLGLYALIKRKVKNIIVLDAEQESLWYCRNNPDQERYIPAVFGALQKLRCRLYAEHGLHLMIGRYGEDPSIAPFFGNAEVNPCSQTSSRAQLHFDVRNEAFPYLSGWICLNGATQCDDNDLLNVLYVKLAIDGKRALPSCDTRYGKMLQNYYKAYHSKSDFPHDGTQDIFYSESQYKAYRDLGYDLAKCISFGDQGLSIDYTAQGCPKERPVCPKYGSTE